MIAQVFWCEVYSRDIGKVPLTFLFSLAQHPSVSQKTQDGWITMLAHLCIGLEFNHSPWWVSICTSSRTLCMEGEYYNAFYRCGYTLYACILYTCAHVLQISREIEIHRKMSHVSVVQFVKFFEDKYNVYILMENCGGMVCITSIFIHVQTILL